MSEFIEFAPLRKSKLGAQPNAVTVHSQLLGGKQQYVFTFGELIVSKLGWSEGLKLKFLWDNDAKNTKVKISPTNKIGWCLRKGKKSKFMRVYISNFPDNLTTEKVNQVKVHHELLQGPVHQTGYLILTLPKDFLAD